MSKEKRIKYFINLIQNKKIRIVKSSGLLKELKRYNPPSETPTLIYGMDYGNKKDISVMVKVEKKVGLLYFEAL